MRAALTGNRRSTEAQDSSPVSYLARHRRLSCHVLPAAPTHAGAPRQHARPICCPLPLVPLSLSSRCAHQRLLVPLLVMLVLCHCTTFVEAAAPLALLPSSATTHTLARGQAVEPAAIVAAEEMGTVGLLPIRGYPLLWQAILGESTSLYTLFRPMEDDLQLALDASATAYTVRLVGSIAFANATGLFVNYFVKNTAPTLSSSSFLFVGSGADGLQAQQADPLSAEAIHRILLSSPLDLFNGAFSAAATNTGVNRVYIAALPRPILPGSEPEGPLDDVTNDTSTDGGAAVVVQNVSCSLVLHFGGSSLTWQHVLDSASSVLSAELLVAATDGLSRSTFETTVSVVDMRVQQDTKKKIDELLVDVVVVQGVTNASGSRRTWAPLEVASILTNYANYSSVYDLYDGFATPAETGGGGVFRAGTSRDNSDGNGTGTGEERPPRRAGQLLAIGMAEKYSLTCTSTCIGMIAMGTIVGAVTLIVLAVGLLALCCCYGGLSGNSTHKGVGAEGSEEAPPPAGEEESAVTDAGDYGKRGVPTEVWTPSNASVGTGVVGAAPALIAHEAESPAQSLDTAFFAEASESDERGSVEVANGDGVVNAVAVPFSSTRDRQPATTGKPKREEPPAEQRSPRRSRGSGDGVRRRLWLSRLMAARKSKRTDSETEGPHEPHEPNPLEGDGAAPQQYPQQPLENSVDSDASSSVTPLSSVEVVEPKEALPSRTSASHGEDDSSGDCHDEQANPPLALTQTIPLQQSQQPEDAQRATAPPGGHLVRQGSRTWSSSSRLRASPSFRQRVVVFADEPREDSSYRGGHPPQNVPFYPMDRGSPYDPGRMRGAPTHPAAMWPTLARPASSENFYGSGYDLSAQSAWAPHSNAAPVQYTASYANYGPHLNAAYDDHGDFYAGAAAAPQPAHAAALQGQMQQQQQHVEGDPTMVRLGSYHQHHQQQQRAPQLAPALPFTDANHSFSISSVSSLSSVSSSSLNSLE